MRRPRIEGLRCIAPRSRRLKPEVQAIRTSRASPTTPTLPAIVTGCSAGRRAQRSERHAAVPIVRRRPSTGEALRFADELSLERRAELLQHRVDECWITDQFGAAIEAQEEALECRRELGDQRMVGDALRTLSRLLFFVARVREGERLALEAIELLERLPPGHELAMAYGNLSQRRMVIEDAEAALRGAAVRSSSHAALMIRKRSCTPLPTSAPRRPGRTPTKDTGSRSKR